MIKEVEPFITFITSVVFLTLLNLPKWFIAFNPPVDNALVGKNKKVREIAKKVLKLDGGITLEHYTESDTDNTLLLECVYNTENIKILLIN